MGRKSVYIKQIEHLLSVGYEAKDIVKITNYLEIQGKMNQYRFKIHSICHLRNISKSDPISETEYLFCKKIEECDKKYNSKIKTINEF